MPYKPVTLKQIMEFFGMTANEFRKEWYRLTVDERAAITAGLSDGTYTY